MPDIWDELLPAPRQETDASVDWNELLPQSAPAAPVQGSDPWDQLLTEPAAPPAPVQESPGPMGHILGILGALDKPRNALAAAVYHAGDEVGALGGLKRGWQQSEDVSWGDLVGIPRPTQEDTWPAYLSKGAGRFGLDAIFDPLNIIAALGLGAKAGGLANKAAKGIGLGPQLETVGKYAQLGKEAFAGTTFAKLFAHGSPSASWDALVNSIRREGGESMQTLDALLNKVDEVMTTNGINPSKATMKGIREGIERPLGPEGQALNPEVRAAFQDLKDYAFSKLGEYNTLAEPLGFDVKKAITEDDFYKWLPRVLTNQAKIDAAPWLPWAQKVASVSGKEASMPSALNINALPLKSRVLERFVDADALAAGELKDPFNRLIISKSDPESLAKAGIINHPILGPIVAEGNHWVPVKGVQASQAELVAKGIDKFVVDPKLALASDVVKKQAKIDFLKLVKEGLDSPEGWMKTVAYDKGQKIIDPGYRIPNIPGMQDVQVKKWVANQLENMHSIAMAPDKATGVLEAFLKAFNDSKLGQYLNLATTHWKRNQLALFPGWHFANAVSNQILAYLSGVRDPRMIKWAADVQFAGKGASAIGKYTNEDLYNEFVKRQLPGTGWGGTYGTSSAMQKVEEAQKVRMTERLGEKAAALGVPEAIASAPAKIGKGWEKWNDKGFNVGRIIEDNTKIAVALNYIKKAEKAGRTVDDRLLDEAVQHAQNYLFDYGQLTSFERQLKSFVPFYSWFRNIIGRTAKDVVTAPNDLARIGRFADLTLRPLSQQDKELAPQWMLSPAYGSDTLTQALGFQPGQNITEVGRFIPQGSVQEFMPEKKWSDPGRYAIAQTAPWMRALLEGVWGQSYHDSRAIDDQAGSLLAGIANPVTGGPYELASKKFFGMDIPRAWDYIQRSYMPTARYANTLNTLGADVLWDEPANQIKMGPAARTAWAISGGKMYPFERQKYQAQQLKEWRKELQGTRTDIMSAAMRGDQDRIQHYLKIYQERAKKNPMAHMPEGE